MIALALSACNSAQKEQIVSSKDYDKFLITSMKKHGTDLEQCNLTIKFWEEKLNQRQDGYIYYQKLADAFEERFELTGNGEDLMRVDSLLQKVLPYLNDKEKAADYLRLAQNAITQHQFKKAETYVNLAAETHYFVIPSKLVAFDVAMELGEYGKAAEILELFKEQEDFDILIRQSKFKDHEGDLPTAIALMEKAFELVKNNKSHPLYTWTLGNLGDMYGHAGEIKKSYEAFLKVLSQDPGYDHAWKGLAWMAYAHDGNTIAANRIIDSLFIKKSIPDLLWLKAELAGHKGDQGKRLKLLNEFCQIASEPEYGDMYNKYLILAYSEELRKPEKALQLAKKEVKNRPTPETYALLAWAYLHSGEKEKALAVIQQKVEGKSSEPEILYQAGIIYLINKKRERAKTLLAMAEESSFELGPLKEKKLVELSKEKNFDFMFAAEKPFPLP